MFRRRDVITYVYVLYHFSVFIRTAYHLKAVALKIEKYVDVM